MSKEVIKQILDDPQALTKVCYKYFSKADNDNSGVIDLGELNNILEIVAKNVALPKPTPEEVIQIFKIFDLDQSQKLSFPEFELIVTAFLKRALEK